MVVRYEMMLSIDWQALLNLSALLQTVRYSLGMIYTRASQVATLDLVVLGSGELYSIYIYVVLGSLSFH